MIANWPQYRNTATGDYVQAVAITAIVQRPIGTATITAGAYGSYEVSDTFMKQWNPAVGGYLITAPSGGGSFVYLRKASFEANYAAGSGQPVSPNDIVGATAIGRGVLTAATGADALTAQAINVTWRNVMLTANPTDTNMNAFAAQNSLIRRTAVPTSTVRAGVLQQAAQADSVATDVAGVNDTLNATLAKLRTAGVLAV